MNDSGAIQKIEPHPLNTPAHKIEKILEEHKILKDDMTRLEQLHNKTYDRFQYLEKSMSQYNPLEHDSVLAHIRKDAKKAVLNHLNERSYVKTLRFFEKTHLPEMTKNIPVILKPAMQRQIDLILKREIDERLDELTHLLVKRAIVKQTALEKTNQTITNHLIRKIKLRSTELVENELRNRLNKTNREYNEIIQSQTKDIIKEIMAKRFRELRDALMPTITEEIRIQVKKALRQNK